MLAAALLIGLRLYLYGDPLPLTAYAKAPNLFNGYLYAKTWFLSTGVVPLLCVAWWRPRSAVIIIGWVGVTTLTGGDWMPGGRRTMEATLGLAIALGSLQTHGRWMAFATALWLCTSAHDIVHERSATRWYHQAFADIGDRARQSKDIARIAAFDIGRLGWHSHTSVYDLAGLTDKHIGQSPGSHGQKAFDAAYFDAQAPDLVILTTRNDPPWHRGADRPWGPVSARC